MTATPVHDRVRGDHFVQFYESDAFLAEAVASYVGSALAVGHRAVIIATALHRNHVADVLLRRGIDSAAAAARGQFLALDAAGTLAKFMAGTLPDRALFREVIGGVVERMTAGGVPLRAFGEMVALLAADGNRAAAMQLEALWNELRAERDFGLFCAYPLGEFTGENDGAPFSEICGLHDHVVPTESFVAAADEHERLRTVSMLQQKA